MSTSALQSHVDRLTDALCVWEGRDDARPQAGARQAANVAVDAIDGALAELHRMRQDLIGDIRRSDDATDARVDDLLNRLRTKDVTP